MINITEIPATYQLAVYRMLGSREMCDRWWTTQNYNFWFKTPLEQWEEDDRIVKAYIDRHFDELLD
jgi:hypothetical protein